MRSSTRRIRSSTPTASLLGLALPEACDRRGRKAFFDRTAPSLRQRRVLLPALESLTRLIGHVLAQTED